MLTDYERSQLERAVDCIRAGCCPKNLDELAGILERCLMADHRTAERMQVYKHPASKRLLKAMDKYDLHFSDGATVGIVIAAITGSEKIFQDDVIRRVKRRNSVDRTGG